MKFHMLRLDIMAKNIIRNSLIHIEQAFKVNPIVALLGPRQCGKSTLANDYAKKIKGDVHFFDLENPNDLYQLENPILALGDFMKIFLNAK